MLGLICNKKLSLKEKISFAKMRSERAPEPIEIRVKSFGDSLEGKRDIPKIIWMYWEDEELPFIVLECYNAIQSLHPNYEVHLLNKKTIGQYISIFSWNTNLPTPNFSDLVRLELIANYGGVWLDASSIFLKSIDKILAEVNIQLKGLILFYNSLTTSNEEFPILESWFIAAPPQDPFIKAWLDEFKRCIHSDNPLMYYKNRTDYNALIQKMDNADYLLVYVAAQIVLRSFKHSMTLIDAATLGCFYWFSNIKFPFDTRYYAKTLSIMHAPKEISPFIKLTGICRKYLNEYKEKDVINNESIISKFLEINRK